MGATLARCGRPRDEGHVMRRLTGALAGLLLGLGALPLHAQTGDPATRAMDQNRRVVLSPPATAPVPAPAPIGPGPLGQNRRVGLGAAPADAAPPVARLKVAEESRPAR
jgi:hypothetical protein